MPPQKGLRSPTTRTRKGGMSAALYRAKSAVLAQWYARRGIILKVKTHKLEQNKPTKPLTKALLELEIIEAKIETNKEFQRAFVSLTRGHHQLVDWRTRQWEVARGRRNIRMVRKDLKELYAERKKIQEKIDHEMKRLANLT